MDTERAKIISPLVDHFWPDWDDDAKTKMTAVLRPYFRAHYDAYCRMDRDGLLDADSPETEGSDRIGVGKNPDV